MSYRAATDSSGYTKAELLPVAQNICARLNAVANEFPDLPVGPGELLALADDYETTLAAKASRPTANQIAFNVARHELEDALGRDADYVNGVANGNRTTPELSGYRVYDTHRAANPNPPAAPGDPRLRHGGLIGVARYHPEQPGSFNGVQTNTGDPNKVAAWKYFGMFNVGKATLAGLTLASTVWVRVRTAGRGGAMGAQSDPAKIIVV